jgi:disulfide bond formation protein DsbB
MYAPLLTLVFALVASTGSLYLSLGVGLKACPLCFYQRTFAFALVAVAAVGLLAFKSDAGKLNLLTLPLCVGGLGVAGFHLWLVQTGKLACPNGIADLGPAPLQSTVAFTLILLPILYGVFVESRDECLKPLPLLAGVGLGLAAVYGSTTPGLTPGANPPPQQQAEGEKLETCKKPFVPQ